MKHFHRLSSGRNFCFNVDTDSEEIPLSESFLHLAKTTAQSEDHLKHLVSKSLQGLRSGYSPSLVESGVGGTYFMRDEYNRTIGVFKPHDEEMGCMNNPKGFTPKTPSFVEHTPVFRGAEAGEAAFRECAAYILDHEHFSGVPATGLVVCSHPTFSSSLSYTGSLADNFKIGSFQEFKEHDFDAEDISSAQYQQFPVREVHKIAILDIRLLNTDRHGGNILVKTNRSRTNSKEDVLSDGYDSDENLQRHDDGGMMFRMDMDIEDEDDDYYGRKDEPTLSVSQSSAPQEFELIPIDHGYTLPSTISGLRDLWFEWLKWPQAKIPFGIEEQRYIERLSADADVAILKHKFGELLDSECFKVLRTTTMWLKTGSHAGLTPYTIGYALCRKAGDTCSTLEKMSMEAQQQVDADLCETSSSVESNSSLAGADTMDAHDQLYFSKLQQVMERHAQTLFAEQQASANKSSPANFRRK